MKLEESWKPLKTECSSWYAFLVSQCILRLETGPMRREWLGLGRMKPRTLCFCNRDQNY